MMIPIILFFYTAPILLIIKVPNLFSTSLSIGIWILNTVLLIFYLDWWNHTGVRTPKISYRQFIALYNVMPDDFTLGTYDIFYKNNVIDFKSFPDYWQYRWFHKNIEKYQIQQEQLQNQAELVADLQRGLAREQADIDYFMKEHLIK